ncbi:HAMP domain-containing histidine kinase [Clostridium sp. SYSU_GA19001]|uniref:sensor histidine kinase n=1 Tax=Clostridium caldaquaticum TaxID=2940653 RepID=UPI00207719EB|nr:HAMP domain-containing sensor histidine kinase [Clostridium caldaquaticum]MCM8711084.1 HAMP domain-containing histidine kinase [Clostridium caldaquaticum]
MKIKKRLLISNTVMVIIPFVITFIFAYSLFFISSTFLDKDIRYNNLKKLANIRAELLNVRSSILKQNEVALDDNFQKYLSVSLSSINGKYIITDGYTVTVFPQEFSKIDVEKIIERIKDSSLEKGVDINGLTYVIEYADITLKDGAKSKVILMAPTEKIDMFNWFLLITILVFIVSFICINIVMSYEISMKILKPINSLKKAASEISSGNLNCEVIEEGDEEIKELCHDFELMRIQLKDSINMKMKYDDNRKMLVSSISHDLKTPITSIKGYVEGILDGVANTKQKMESYLKTIYSKAEQVDLMIDDLLLYSKLDLNQLPFNFEKTNIIEYFSFCIEETEPELLKANIKIKLENNLEHSKFVMLDRDRMRRVIMNIIDNSCKYMDKEQGEIVIKLRETSTSIIAEIRDNGKGIKESEVNKIFDRFYRADSARSGAKGSGLGLAIAKQIVEGHKGKIWAVSHENEGISIIISLTKITESRGNYEEYIDS